MKFDSFGHEWGRRGSEWAHTRSQRSHGLQEGFWIPPGPPGHHIMSKNDKKIKNLKKSKFSDFPVYLNSRYTALAATMLAVFAA